MSGTAGAIGGPIDGCSTSAAGASLLLQQEVPDTGETRSLVVNPPNFQLTTVARSPLFAGVSAGAKATDTQTRN